VIRTRFPVTSRNAKPYPVDEAIQGKKSVAEFEEELRLPRTGSDQRKHQTLGYLSPAPFEQQRLVA